MKKLFILLLMLSYGNLFSQEIGAFFLLDSYNTYNETNTNGCGITFSKGITKRIIIEPTFTYGKSSSYYNDIDYEYVQSIDTIYWDIVGVNQVTQYYINHNHFNLILNMGLKLIDNPNIKLISGLGINYKFIKYEEHKTALINQHNSLIITNKYSNNIGNDVYLKAVLTNLIAKRLNVFMQYNIRLMYYYYISYSLETQIGISYNLKKKQKLTQNNTQ